MSQQKYVGVWPVMLTPFDAKGEIDWASLERLVDWYIDSGVHGLFMRLPIKRNVLFK